MQSNSFVGNFILNTDTNFTFWNLIAIWSNSQPRIQKQLILAINHMTSTENLHVE